MLDISKLSVESLQTAVDITQRKENLTAEIAQCDRELKELFNGGMSVIRAEPHVKGSTMSARKTTGRKGRFARGELTTKAMALIQQAGATGIAPADLAKNLGCNLNRNIWPWYYGTARPNKNGVGRHRNGPHVGNFVMETKKRKA